MKRTTLKAVVAVIVVGSIFALAEPAFAAPVSIEKSGAWGYWLGREGVNICEQDFYGAYVKPVEPYVGRTPTYPNSVQTVKMISRIDRWNGSSWSVYKWGSWDTRVSNPGQLGGFFSSRSISVTGRSYYRVVQIYEWWVNGRRVGTVTNLFDQYEYMGWSGATVGQTGSGASYCYIP